MLRRVEEQPQGLSMALFIGPTNPEVAVATVLEVDGFIL